jgi:PAS domain S-box-containing protein
VEDSDAMSYWTEQALGNDDLRIAIVDQMEDAVVLADRNGVIRLWNRGAEVLFGFSAEDAIGAGLDLIVPDKFLRGHEEGFKRAVACGRLRTEGRVLTTRAKNKYGSRLYVDFTFGLLKSPSGEVLGVFAIGRDATARHLEEVAMKVKAEQSTA